METSHRVYEVPTTLIVEVSRDHVPFLSPLLD